MNKVGEISWSDNTVDTSEKRTNSKDLFLRLKPGSNIVRLLTLPHQYYQHTYKMEGAKGYGDRITCTADPKTCPLCIKGDKHKRRWMFGVLEKQSGSFKVLDVGWSVFKDINTFAQDEDWGNPQDYDLDIIVKPNAPPNEYYSCVPKPKKLLSATDLKIRDDANLDEVKTRTISPSPEKVQERLDKVIEKQSATITAQSSNNNEEVKGNFSQKGVVATPDEEDEYEFTEVASKSTTKQAPF